MCCWIGFFCHYYSAKIAFELLIIWGGHHMSMCEVVTKSALMFKLSVILSVFRTLWNRYLYVPIHSRKEKLLCPINPSFFSCDQAALRTPLSVRLSVCLSVTPFSLCSCHRTNTNIQELLPMTKVMSMQKVKVRGQRSRSQRSQPNLTVSGL